MKLALALMWAVQEGRADIARMLVDEGADVNAATNVGWTALRIATGNGHADVARMLRRAGAR